MVLMPLHVDSVSLFTLKSQSSLTETNVRVGKGMNGCFTTDINIFCYVMKDYKANNEPALWTSTILFKINPEPNNTI